MHRRMRLLCTCVLILCCTFHAFGADVKVDGDILARTEYNDTVYVLQNIRRESNCNLTDAYLHWRADPANNSLYLGVQYVTTDMDVQPDLEGEELAQAELLTGIEITVNGTYCGVVQADRRSFRELDGTQSVYVADGYSPDLNRDRCALEAKWRFFTKTTPNTQCEMRVGLKYWEGEDLRLGIRIFDYSGESSNYHTVPVYKSPTASTTHPQTERTTREKTTRESTTRETTTKAPTTQESVAPTASAARPETTQKPPATARDPRMMLTAVSDHRQGQTVIPESERPLTMHTTTKESADTSRKISRTQMQANARQEETTSACSSESAQTFADAHTAAARESAGTESGEETSFPIPVRVSGIRSRGRILGIVAASAFVTGAVMFSAFSMGRRSAADEREKDETE